MFACGCVGVDAQSLLVSSTSALYRKSVEVVVLQQLLCYNNNFLDVGSRVGSEVVVCAACLLTATSLLGAGKAVCFVRFTCPIVASLRLRVDG